RDWLSPDCSLKYTESSRSPVSGSGTSTSADGSNVFAKKGIESTPANDRKSTGAARVATSNTARATNRLRAETDGNAPIGTATADSLSARAITVGARPIAAAK